MPIGVFLCNGAVALGSLLGGKLGRHIPFSVKDVLPLIFGLCSIGIAVTCIVQVDTLAVIVISMIAGTIIGTLLRLEDKVQRGFGWIFRKLKVDHRFKNETEMQQFITITVLFCVSGAGIFGAINEGITGDTSLLVAKAVLDLFTALTFASVLGYAVGIIAIFQCAILSLLFFSAQFLMLVTTPTMLADFNACGGIITLAAGLKLCRMFQIKLVNLLPALVLALPVSYWWGLLPI